MEDDGEVVKGVLVSWQGVRRAQVRWKSEAVGICRAEYG